MMASTSVRLDDYPFTLHSELRDAANEHGYRIGPEQAAGWLFFRSATAPGEIAVAATSSGMAGPFFLSVEHPGAARELGAAVASPSARGHAGAFAYSTRESLFEAVSTVYRLSISLPTLPFEEFIRETQHLGDTEAERTQKVRIGQDRFRDALMNYWNGVCPLTGISNPELLRASHIIGWADCDSDQERLNVYNGLLLSSLWDAAFDTGLVTFDDDGRVIVSPAMNSKAIQALQIENTPVLSLTDEHRRRLAWHRLNRWQVG
jgi:putative restriction endonuclease